MKKNLISAVLISATLVGCGDSKEQPSASTTAAPASSIVSSSDGSHQLTLKDGAKISVNGKLVRNVTFTNESGTFQRYIFDVDEKTMSIEGTLFADMAKSGYNRVIKTDSPEVYAVHYQKKGFPSVGATYTSLETKQPDENSKTRLMLLWKI
ncbi:hypothetical protein A0O30_06705 [Pseudomonas sp. LLC-1]|uniref:hypothetical protein n=1 Tax=Pseudomonas sp. LLC-1 TaxID=1812180 RepID=UPI000D016D8E|nr:hypothetical protein [Pseudomonas sp. LLC-1]PRN05730.1 hypothetical protein A0O30_06705 [Pseudomonas sp. LLC-1]